MIGFGSAIPEPEPFLCPRCMQEIVPTDEQLDLAKEGESIFCNGCEADAPLGRCDSCDAFGPLRSVPFGNGNTIGDGRFCWDGCGIDWSGCR